MPAKDRPVPCAAAFGAVQERSRATYEDRPVAGVEIIEVLFTSSTSLCVVAACRKISGAEGKVEVARRGGK